MEQTRNTSEVARLRQQIALEYEAAQRGLSGLAQGVAQHEYITARLERMSEHHEYLKHLVGEQEALSFLVKLWEQN